MRCTWEKSSGSGGELAFYKYTHAVPNYTKSFPWKVRSLRLTTILSLDLFFFLSQTSQVHLDAIPGRGSGVPAGKQRYSLYSSGELPEQTLWVEYYQTLWVEIHIYMECVVDLRGKSGKPLDIVHHNVFPRRKGRGNTAGRWPSSRFGVWFSR